MVQFAPLRPPIAPPLYELSFVTRQTLPAVSAMRTRLRFRNGFEGESIGNPMAQWRRLIPQLKQQLGTWLTVEGDLIGNLNGNLNGNPTDELAIVYPEPLSWGVITATIEAITAQYGSAIQLEAIEACPIDLRDPQYRRLLLQYCNYELCRVFRNAPSTRVNETRQRIYSTKNLWTIGNEAEVQRYLKFDFVIDDGESLASAEARGDRLVLCLDYANEYRSLPTLNQLDPRRRPLKAQQRLIQTYNGKRCESVAWAQVSVGQPLDELHGESLLDYHHRRGHLGEADRTAIDPRDRAVLVRYSPKSPPIHHLPHLLKRLYDRQDLRASQFDRFILPIDQKAHLASQSVNWLNRQGFCVGDRLEFDTTLRQAPERVVFNSGQRRQNLDFGVLPGQHNRRLCVSEVWHGWSKRHLLERPDRIRTQVIYPAEWAIEMRNYIDGLRKIFSEFGIALDHAGDPRPYNPLNRASLHTTYQNLPDCDLVFAFVPTRDDPGFDIDINPYNTLKQHLFDQQIPSQMVTYNTARKAARQNALADGFAQNVVLSIIAKLGYLPWQIHDMPGTAEAFIGLDLGRVGDRGTVAAACIVNARGKLIGWASRCLGGGETIGAVELRSMLSDLIVAYYQSCPVERSVERSVDPSGVPPLRHLVIHRDGTFKNQELATIRAIEQELRADGLDRLDLVEIVKDTVIRAATWNGQRYINPDRGSGWRHTTNEAIVLTTGHQQAKVAANAAPQPLLIRRRSGDTDLMTLAEQVYWLSEMQVGSSQVVRLPVTTYFPDRIAEVTLKGLLPREVRHATRPWFL